MYVDCKQISEELLGEIKNDAAHLGFNKEIAIVKSAKNSAGTVYENAIIKKAEKLNIPVRSAVLEEGVDTEKAFKTVEKLSEDKDIAGIIPMQPLDEGIDISRVKEAIACNKDIDGQTEKSMSGVFSFRKNALAPATALACIEIAKKVLDKENFKTLKVCILGRSLVVGRPLAMLFMKDDATVTVCHSKTGDDNIISSMADADIIVSAVGIPHFVTKEMVEGSFERRKELKSIDEDDRLFIDVGINFKDGKITGDMESEAFKDEVAYVTPVPSGVGLVTTSVLFKNLLKGYRQS